MLAAYLHDVGKAVSTFQLRLRSAGPRCNASLRGHEFWSAWIAYHTAERLCGEKTAALISVAVALHHAPRCSIDDVVLDALKIPTTEGDIEAMSSLAEEGAQLLGLDRDRVVAGLAVARWHWLRYFTAPHAQWLWRLRNTISRHRLQTAVELLRYIVVLVDNMDNALTRRDKATLLPFLK
ncbi:MAG: CRISPR-associated endonuclease Cas3'' [Sulfolobales archaeon]